MGTWLRTRLFLELTAKDEKDVVILRELEERRTASPLRHIAGEAAKTDMLQI